MLQSEQGMQVRNATANENRFNVQKSKGDQSINMLQKYCCVKQHDQTDCGAACIATIAKQYKANLSIATIREKAGTDTKGTSVYGLIHALKDFGFRARAVKGEPSDLFGGLLLPAIAHIATSEGLLHYVVLHKIRKRSILVADPAKGMISYKPEEFLSCWTGILILVSLEGSLREKDASKSIYSRFFILLEPYKSLVVQLFFSSMVITLLGVGAAFYFKILMDEVLRYGLLRTLHIISIGVIGLSTFQILLEAFRSHLLLHLSQKIDIPLILGFYEHVLHLPMGFFGSRKTGEILSRFMDSSKIREAISAVTLTVLIDTLMVLAGAVILYLQSAALFGIAAMMVVMYGVLVFLFLPQIRKINEKAMEENAQMTASIIEGLQGIETIKAFNQQEQAFAKSELKFLKMLGSIFQMGMLNNIQESLTQWVSMIGGIVILWVGSYKVIQGEMSVGQLLVFNSLLVYFLNPVKNLIHLQPTMQGAIVASNRLGEILDLEREVRGSSRRAAVTPASFRVPLLVREVDFRYGTREKVLQGLSLEVNPGEVVAVLGESGCGKSTLAKLLMGFHPPEKGEILLGDHNIQDIDLATLRERVAYVSQDTFLFHGSIRDNLLMGNEKASAEEVIAAAKQGAIHEFITSLPQRYETVLEENAANLSGGQRQRLALARAFLKKPDLLILDEATSSLDPVSEKAIEAALTSLAGDTAVLCITHRLEFASKCHRIYVLHHGRVAEARTHQELMEHRGKYWAFWQEQIEHSL